MRNLVPWVLIACCAATAVGCHDDDAPTTAAAPSAPRPAPRRIQPVPPPLDLQKPPADATTTGSGLVYKRLVTQRAGAQLTTGDTAMIRYTAWRQRTGETFFTTSARGQAIAIQPETATPAFREALPLLRKGEKVMLWVHTVEGSSEPVVYEIELVDVVAPAPVMAQPAVATEGRDVAQASRR